MKAQIEPDLQVIHHTDEKCDILIHNLKLIRIRDVKVLSGKKYNHPVFNKRWIM